MNRKEFEQAGQLAAKQQAAELQAQTGNLNFQHGYDPECAYCFRDIPHTDAQHEASLRRNYECSRP